MQKLNQANFLLVTYQNRSETVWKTNSHVSISPMKSITFYTGIFQIITFIVLFLKT